MVLNSTDSAAALSHNTECYIYGFVANENIYFYIQLESIYLNYIWFSEAWIIIFIFKIWVSF